MTRPHISDQTILDQRLVDIRGHVIAATDVPGGDALDVTVRVPAAGWVRLVKKEKA